MEQVNTERGIVIDRRTWLVMALSACAFYVLGRWKGRQETAYSPYLKDPVFPDDFNNFTTIHLSEKPFVLSTEPTPYQRVLWRLRRLLNGAFGKVEVAYIGITNNPGDVGVRATIEFPDSVRQIDVSIIADGTTTSQVTLTNSQVGLASNPSGVQVIILPSSTVEHGEGWIRPEDFANVLVFPRSAGAILGCGWRQGPRVDLALTAHYKDGKTDTWVIKGLIHEEGTFF